MRELGSIEEAAHRQVGEWAAQVVEILVTVGARGRWIAEGARQAGLPADRVHAVEGRREAAELLAEVLQPGDHVLIKGSRAMEMEKVVAALVDSERLVP
jgi:UDP-N-acetylmuramoyl-tripeptide--D-alanyl-D-alanine ligase